MARCFAFLLTLLACQSVLGDCQPRRFPLSGTELAATVPDEDVAEIESMIGEDLEWLVCGRLTMLPGQSVQRTGTPFGGMRGFLALAEEEVVFVADARRKRIMMRLPYGDITRVESQPIRFERGVATLFVTLLSQRHRYDLGLPVPGADGFLAELRRRMRQP